MHTMVMSKNERAKRVVYKVTLLARNILRAWRRKRSRMLRTFSAAAQQYVRLRPDSITHTQRDCAGCGHRTALHCSRGTAMRTEQKCCRNGVRKQSVRRKADEAVRTLGLVRIAVIKAKMSWISEGWKRDTRPHMRSVRPHSASRPNGKAVA